jgi:hypothetical protein
MRDEVVDGFFLGGELGDVMGLEAVD